MKIARESPLSRTRYILRIPYELRINVAEFGESGARFNLLPTREDRSSFRLIALRHDAHVTPASLEIVKRFEMWRASFETRNVSDGGTSSDENHDEIPITRLEESLISGQVLRLREIFEDIDLDETSW